jgi:hypothetical protein
MIPMLRKAVDAHDYRLQSLAQSAVDAGMLIVHRPSEIEAVYFKNVNTPDDIQ